MASGTRVRCRGAAGAVLACAAVALALASGTAAAAAASAATPSVRLLHQTPVVQGPNRLLSLSLSRTGPAAAAGATVRLTLYSRLTTRSGLLAAIGAAGPVSPVSSTPRLAASCLTALGQLRLTVAVDADGAHVAPRQLCGGVAPVLRLGCTTGCDGVYPLRVTVAGGGATASLVTLVTYASRSPLPLRVAWVVRVAGRPRGLAPAAAALKGVAAHPRVPLTIDVEGSTVANGRYRPGGAAAVTLLRAATAAADHELIGEPYVPADLGALQASGLTSEITRQYALNKVALLNAGIPAAPSQTVTFATGPQTPTMVDAAGAVGMRHLLISGDALDPDPATTLAWGAAFHVDGSSPAPTALATDTGLAALSEQAAADPGLTAAQFLGQLAFLHFEQPDLAQPLAVVVVTTASSQVTTSFTDDVLAGLAANPVLRAVTATGAFAAVPVGANGFPPLRSLLLGQSRPFPKPTISYVSFLRLTTDALSSSVTSGVTPIPSIEGELLSAERVLPPVARAEILNNVHLRLEQQLGHFHVDNGSITLTESGASLPITVLSSAPYSVIGTLRLSSSDDRIVFPNGSTVPRFVIPAGSTGSVRVAARTETTGDLPLTVELLSADGRLVLAHADIVVRTTPTSIVGIALTVGAVLVLALWWIRTSRRRRRSAAG